MPDARSVSAVTLGTLVRICATLHAVPRDRLPALKGRFSNFHKLGFPGVKPAGTGARAEYWPEHVAQLLIAFELVRFRMPQTAAAKAVSDHREVVLSAVGKAARASVGDDRAHPIVLSVTSNALTEDAKVPDLADVAIAAVDRLQPSMGASTMMVVDVDSLITRAAAAASATDEPFGVTFFAGLGRV